MCTTRTSLLPGGGVATLSLPVLLTTGLVGLLVVLKGARGFPTAASAGALRGVAISADEQDWLTQYGYIVNDGTQADGPTGGGAALQSSEKIRQAIRLMQRFAGINETGVIDEATKEKMRQPRCGLPDISGQDRRLRKKRYNIQGNWDKTDLTYKFVSYGDPTVLSLSESEIRYAVERAFAVWSEVAPLTFTEVWYGDADINIDFRRFYHGDNFPFDGAGGVLAHAFFPGEGIGGDTHFDEDEPWSVGTGTGVDIFVTASHEFGHALGLHHSSSPGSLMSPYYNYYDMNTFTLPDDDRQGIQTLYGRRHYRNRDPDDAPRTSIPENPTPPIVITENPNIIPGANPPISPQQCQPVFDAIADLRGELFFFHNEYFWRKRAGGGDMSGPWRIHSFWEGIPDDVRKIDAVYERLTDGRIFFFAGPRYWIFEDRYAQDRTYYLRDIGLPDDGIDAALQWRRNGKIYFFKDDIYWRFKDDVMDYGYPKDISKWTGVPAYIDAVFQARSLDGTYFVKDDLYWKFNDGVIEVEYGYPRDFALDFLGCTPRFVPSRNDVNVISPILGNQVSNSTASWTASAPHTLTLTTLASISVLFYWRT
ncbi:PREDICTED: matrix metalloproteinase-24-like [Branchiostoma belcheri]|uniref:Matrix metalloproteinase-24-like n=1 Tax=Branchiostoma belcheri TaxID=7741 RepID=A0A6P4YQH5_BRABE|nr:PREDICTED: matrix metalloproteinase-24-like [Branchiostoma belcheri]XP_019620922.1 PREDICTED: matrix metalloproteinase-24-like [Branchiostoma belcheri]